MAKKHAADAKPAADDVERTTETPPLAESPVEPPVEPPVASAPVEPTEPAEPEPLTVEQLARLDDIIARVEGLPVVLERLPRAEAIAAIVSLRADVDEHVTLLERAPSAGDRLVAAMRALRTHGSCMELLEAAERTLRPLPPGVQWRVLENLSAHRIGAIVTLPRDVALDAERRGLIERVLSE